MQNPQCLLCLVYLIKQQNRINKWYKQSLQAICQNWCASFATAGTWTGISNHPWKRTSNSPHPIWYFFHSIFLPLSPRPQPQNAKWHCILKSVRTWQAAGSLFSVNPLATSNPALTLDNVFVLTWHNYGWKCAFELFVLGSPEYLNTDREQDRGASCMCLWPFQVLIV